MSYLERIKECNKYNLNLYTPFLINGEQLGLVSQEMMWHLQRWPEVFKINETAASIHHALEKEADISAATAPVFAQLHAEGVIDTWVNELYPVVQNFGEKPRMYIERAATPYMGTKSFGVHVNGLVRKPQGIHVWVGKRTKDKPFWPGKLDQMVAGGQPAGMRLMENVIKESAEEAGIPKQLAGQARQVTTLSYCGESSRGINPDTLFVYDLWLPEGFTPVNTDGEVDSFQLINLKELAEIVDNTQEFKENCNLVNIDLLLRQGIITTEHADYEQITRSLYNANTVF